MNYSDGLIAMFKFIFELSTIATLISFLFCAIARLLLLGRTKSKAQNTNLIALISISAFAYGMFAVASAQESVVYWSMLLLLIGLPIYAWVKAK